MIKIKELIKWKRMTFPKHVVTIVDVSNLPLDNIMKKKRKKKPKMLLIVPLLKCRLQSLIARQAEKVSLVHIQLAHC